MSIIEFYDAVLLVAARPALVIAVMALAAAVILAILLVVLVLAGRLLNQNY